MVGGGDTREESEQLACEAINFALELDAPVEIEEAGEEIGYFWITVHRHAPSIARRTA